MTDEEKARAALDGMFAQHAEELGPLGIKCRACNAKPGEQCAGIVKASHTLTEPHAMRVADARAAGASNEIEQARAKRLQLIEHEQSRKVQEMTTSALKALPDAAPNEQLTAVSIALIKLADAHGFEREGLIEAFSEIARTLPYPSAVLV